MAETRASSSEVESPVVDWSDYLSAMQNFQASVGNKYRRQIKSDAMKDAPKDGPQEWSKDAPEPQEPQQAREALESSKVPEVPEPAESDDAAIHKEPSQEDEDEDKALTNEPSDPPKSPGRRPDDIRTVNNNNKVFRFEVVTSIPQPTSPVAQGEPMPPLSSASSSSDGCVTMTPRRPIHGRGLGNGTEDQVYLNDKEIEPEESKSPAMMPETKEESSDDDSNGSDEVIFRQSELNMVGPRINASAFRHGRARLVKRSSNESQKENNPPVQRTPSNGTVAAMTQRANQERPNVDTDRTVRQDRRGSLEVQTPPKEAKAKRNVKEELKKLQQAEMIKFGRKQMGLDAEVNPKTGSLYLARQGPGTDPTSPFAQGLRKLIAGAPDPLLLKNTQDISKAEGDSPNPSGSNPSGPRQVYSGEQDLGDRLEIKKWSEEKEDFSPMVVDWQYRPWETYGDDHFVRNFRSWLENTMRLGYPVDMKHACFKDGTFIPDGINGMVPASFEVPETRVDPSDQHNATHAHEAAAGYVHNWNLRLEREVAEKAEKEQQRLLQKRASQVPMITVTPEEEPNPYAPKAKVYLRPVEDKDVPALVALYNWYVRNTVRRVDTEEITNGEMKEQIDDIEHERFPFVVAAEHKPHHGHAMNGQDEMIYGYASVCDFTGPNSTQRCSGEVEVFVHPKMHRAGIGRCLLDKVVEICDPKYPAKHGYLFDCAPDKRHIYCAGYNRLLSRLVMIVHHVADEAAEYQWIKSWLEKEFRFDEQGMLKGVGVKNGRPLNSGYLVYDTSVKHK